MTSMFWFCALAGTEIVERLMPRPANKRAMWSDVVVRIIVSSSWM
jgi:hypothetical protein